MKKMFLLFLFIFGCCNSLFSMNYFTDNESEKCKVKKETRQEYWDRIQGIIHRCNEREEERKQASEIYRKRELKKHMLELKYSDLLTKDGLFVHYNNLNRTRFLEEKLCLDNEYSKKVLHRIDKYLSKSKVFYLDILDFFLKNQVNFQYKFLFGLDSIVQHSNTAGRRGWIKDFNLKPESEAKFILVNKSFALLLAKNVPGVNIQKSLVYLFHKINLSSDNKGKCLRRVTNISEIDNNLNYILNYLGLGEFSSDNSIIGIDSYFLKNNYLIFKVVN